MSLTDERYKQLMNDVGMPNSRSLLQALQQVANEVEQKCNARAIEAETTKGKTLDELIATVEKKAEETAWCDDEEFMVDDYAGGNMDDAYQGGIRDGEIVAAREFLELLRNLK